MKFILLVVGKTVEKHYITAIADYVERTKHYTSFDMEVIPELKKYQEPEHGATERKRRRTDTESSPARRCSGIARRTRKRIPLRRIRQLDRTEDAHRKQTTGIHHRRSLWFRPIRICRSTRENLPFQDDLLSSDDTPHLCRTTLPCAEHLEQQSVPPRINQRRRKMSPTFGAGSSGFILFILYRFFRRMPYFCEMEYIDSPSRTT